MNTKGPKPALKSELKPGTVVKVYDAGRSGPFRIGIVIRKSEVPTDFYGIPKLPGWNRKFCNDDIAVQMSDGSGIVVTHKFRLEKA